MKNSTAPKTKSVSSETEKKNVHPVRVSDMGMRVKVSKEFEKEQPSVVSI